MPRSPVRLRTLRLLGLLLSGLAAPADATPAPEWNDGSRLSPGRCGELDRALAASTAGAQQTGGR